MTEPTIKAKRLAYVRVQAPDLDKAEAFLAEFGLEVTDRQNGAVYFRGTDAMPHCYVLTKGSGGVHGIAFEADTEDDLIALSALDGASAVEPLNEPGGGHVVRLTDPQGTAVEVVHGQASLPALEPPGNEGFNMNGQVQREGVLATVQRGPARVKRLGHLVLESGDPDTVYQWYASHLGLKVSDAIRLPDGQAQMLFSRLDRGATYVDHHVVGFQFALDEGARVQHMAFEVSNFDTLMAGHDHLKRRKRKHVWGIGRHRFGGQIFDYWANPWGVIHEHWTDTDLLNANEPSKDNSVADVVDYWGPAPPPSFIVSRWNTKAFRNIARLLKARSRA